MSVTSYDDSFVFVLLFFFFFFLFLFSKVRFNVDKTFADYLFSTINKPLVPL